MLGLNLGGTSVQVINMKLKLYNENCCIWFTDYYVSHIIKLVGQVAQSL